MGVEGCHQTRSKCYKTFFDLVLTWTRFWLVRKCQAYRRVQVGSVPRVQDNSEVVELLSGPLS